MLMYCCYSQSRREISLSHKPVCCKICEGAGQLPQTQTQRPCSDVLQVQAQLISFLSASGTTAWPRVCPDVPLPSQLKAGTQDILGSPVTSRLCDRLCGKHNVTFFYQARRGENCIITAVNGIAKIESITKNSSNKQVKKIDNISKKKKKKVEII